MLNPPYPTLEALLEMIGDAGRRMAEIEASEGAAGNISIFVRWQMDVRHLFPLGTELALPQPVPELAGATIIVSGSGRRLRELKDDPPAHLACLVIDEGGQTGRLLTSHQRRFERVTSEFNSHLGVHHDQVLATGSNFHAVIHAQPLHLTFLSHIPRYQDARYLNAHLLRWQPETILNLPEGFGVLPFEVPGSARLMAGNIAALRQHRMVIWAKHGVMARSDTSIKRAADLVEYAEAAAKYEYMNLRVGEMGEGLSEAEIRAICAAYNVNQAIF
ncbi:MAG: class II aldolase/adducin family protein [Anaerolineales bacterium]|jgi:rhamnulose-1-phosphate aldolase|nr:class II aldolase/adducin family protein [Anaerolineales bacterium]